MPGRMNKLLEATVQQVAASDPNSLIDVVVTPHKPEDVMALAQHIQSLGGSTVSSGPDVVQAQVPAGQVARLAESPHVSSMRLARMHSMH
jgi:hypothetical protein